MVKLDDSTIEMLRSLRTKQETYREHYGSDYRTDINLVFCSPHGGYLKPDSVSSKCSLIAQKAGLKDTSVHTLRHSHGSQLHSGGVPLSVISKRFGHANAYTTATIYTHALTDDEIAAAEVWGKKMDKVIERDRNAKLT